VAHAVRAGKALYAGLSNYKADETRQAAQLLREMGAPCLIHQPRYSMFDRWVEGGLLQVLAEAGAGCIAFSPLAQGLLTEKYLRGIPEGSRASKAHGFLRPAHVTPEKLAQASRLNAQASARGQTLAQLALAWVLRHPSMTSVLIGASSVAQIEENIKTLDHVALSAEELKSIEAILAPS
jgi:L-glyceraldehyde 3-phosphate reductase